MLETQSSWLSQAQSRLEAAPESLITLRRAASARFEALGFPTRKDEDWRYLPLAPLAETEFHEPSVGRLSAEDLATLPFSDLETARLVFVNGRYRPELSHADSLPKGVWAGSLKEAWESFSDTIEAHLGKIALFESQAFIALNSALFEDAAFVFVPRGMVVETPIHLLYVTVAEANPTANHPRALLVASENSHITLIETYVGAGEGVTLTNAVTEIVAENRARVEHYKAQNEGASAYHIAQIAATLGRDSVFVSQNIAIGGALARTESAARFGAEGGECTLNGLSLAQGRQWIANHTVIDHAMPHCNSHELYKSILADQSRSVFHGKIMVRPDAQKTDAKQTNQTLLLSEEAQINTKPQLEIFADDVKCTHGATVGQLNADSLFYLRARGVGLDEAKSLLTYAFASEIIDQIKVKPLRDQIHCSLFQQLPSAIRPDEEPNR